MSVFQDYYNETKPVSLRIHDMLDGAFGISEKYYVGYDCVRKHGKNGKTIRYKHGDKCIRCATLNEKKKIRKKHQKESQISKKHEHAIELSNKKKDDLVDLLW